MKLRLFADQCVPLEIVLALRDQGHEVLLLRDHLPIRSIDPLVIAKAQELNCLFLSRRPSNNTKNMKALAKLALAAVLLTASVAARADWVSGHYSNPYFWAAFTLTGQWR